MRAKLAATRWRLEDRRPVDEGAGTYALGYNACMSKIPGKGLIVAVVGRHASDPAPPFDPKVEVRGFVPSKIEMSEMHELVTSATESSLPWLSADLLRSKVEGMLRRYAAAKPWGVVDVEVVVMDNIPSTRLQGQEVRFP